VSIYLREDGDLELSMSNLFSGMYVPLFALMLPGGEGGYGTGFGAWREWQWEAAYVLEHAFFVKYG
jgi:hypothetical protein